MPDLMDMQSKPFQGNIHAAENKWGGETITISRAINYPTHLKVDVAHQKPEGI
jgi:hypothetical protein